MRKCHSPYLRCCGRSTYTPDGLPARTTYPGGKWKELVYDSNRNVTNILHTARSTPNTSLSFDAFGNITNAIDTAGNAWQFSYTHNSTLTNEVFTSLRLCDSARQTNALARRVDSYSRPVGYDLTLGDTPRSRMRYGYDTEGRIATLAATNAANRGFQVEYLNEAGYNYGYTHTTPNGATLTRIVTRDPFRRSLTLDCTTRFNNVVVATFSYTFDENNRPVSRNNDRFTYNMRDEILSAVIGTNRISHAYDTIGNHVFLAYNAATNFYANNQLNQTTASYACVPTTDSGNNDTPPLFAGYDILSTNRLTWSAQGGLQRDGRFIYAFDAEDQLVSVTSATLTNGAIRVLNAYDYRHRRISKTVYTMRDDSPPPSPLAPPLPIAHRSWHLQERHDFVYDDWSLIHETVTSVDANSTTNVAEIEYFWGPDLSNTLQGAGGVGGLLAVSMNGVFYFPVYDNLGNIVKYIDENGNAVAAYDYDDFGRILSSTGSMSKVFAILFSTKYIDDEIDLYYYGYRFYSHQLFCWLSRDSKEEDESLNLFSFCSNRIFLYDILGQYVNLVFDVEKKTLTATDVDSAETLTLKEKVFSGNGGSCCVKADQWKSSTGPLPVGKYLVGLSYVPKIHSGDAGDYNWYRLYGSNGRGGYTYNSIPVKSPNGTTVYRGGFNLHTGRASDGCVTVWSDVEQGEKEYPHSDDYNKLKKLLNKTKPLLYKNSNYAGWLEVK